MEELPEKPSEYSSRPLVPKGFFPEVVVTDFPVRDRTVYLKIRRRHWEDKTIGKIYSRDWHLVTEGTRITAEFGAFLKEILGDS